jgi:hypothetical protein
MDWHEDPWIGREVLRLMETAQPWRHDVLYSTVTLDRVDPGPPARPNRHERRAAKAR